MSLSGLAVSVVVLGFWFQVELLSLPVLEADGEGMLGQSGWTELRLPHRSSNYLPHLEVNLKLIIIFWSL